MDIQKNTLEQKDHLKIFSGQWNFLQQSLLYLPFLSQDEFQLATKIENYLIQKIIIWIMHSWVLILKIIGVIQPTWLIRHTNFSWRARLVWTGDLSQWAMIQIGLLWRHKANPTPRAQSILFAWEQRRLWTCSEYPTL